MPKLFTLNLTNQITMQITSAYKLLVTIMITGLTQLLGLNANAETKTFPRKVDLSGNVFHFSMPENFSKDMPAENMVEQLDVQDLKKFDNPEYGNIIRRWWDIKRPGFFGKELGTVMMDISVQKVPENSEKLIHSRTYDITNRLDFLLAVDNSLRQRYKKINHDQGSNSYSITFCSLYGKNLESFYRDKIYNQQKWTGYTVVAPLDQLIVGLALPLSRNTFLEVVFTYSPNQNIAPREFLDMAYQTTQPIENSLKLNYLSDNEIRHLVEKAWIDETTDDLMSKNYNAILIPLFGPDIHKKIEEERRNTLKLQKELDKPLEE